MMMMMPTESSAAAASGVSGCTDNRFEHESFNQVAGCSPKSRNRNEHY
jgi:hypothetical protein